MSSADTHDYLRIKKGFLKRQIIYSGIPELCCNRLSLFECQLNNPDTISRAIQNETKSSVALHVSFSEQIVVDIIYKHNDLFEVVVFA